MTDNDGQQLTYFYTNNGMVSTTKSLNGRPKDDYYPTPSKLCDASLRAAWGDLPAPKRVLDPGCGKGAWGKAARKMWPDATIIGVEMVADRVEEARAAGLLSVYDEVRTEDYLSRLYDEQFDAIIGNPPYKLGEDFLMRSLSYLAPQGTLCFLLLTAFSESSGRYGRLYNFGFAPKATYTLVERPSFIESGAVDSKAYSLFVWQRSWTGGTRQFWLSWKRGFNIVSKQFNDDEWTAYFDGWRRDNATEQIDLL